MESKDPDPNEIDAVMKSLMMMTAYANEKASDPHDASVIDAAVEAKAEMAAEKAKVHAPETKAPELIEIPDIPETVAAMDAIDMVELSNIPETSVIPETAEVPETMEVREAAEMQAASETPAPEKAAAVAAVSAAAAAAADISAETIPEETVSEETIPEVSEETREMIHENKEKLMDSIADIAPKEVEDLDKEEAKAQVVPMNDEQWEIMDYFMNVPEIEKQIAEFIETQHRRFTNLVICGRAGSGRASLALRLYKSIRVNNPDLPNQTLKVDADSLNKKSVLKVYEKVGKGLILIEHAELLSGVAVSELIQAMNNTKNSI